MLLGRLSLTTVELLHVGCVGLVRMGRRWVRSIRHRLKSLRVSLWWWSSGRVLSMWSLDVVRDATEDDLWVGLLLRMATLVEDHVLRRSVLRWHLNPLMVL